jgi:ubiquinone biosynthesis protein
MNLQRTQKIEHAVDVGMRRWRAFGAATPAEGPPAATPHRDVVQTMPRRKPAHVVDSAHVTLPMARRIVFKPGIILPFFRLFVWIWACIKFFSGSGFDVLLGRASMQRRAVRLREVFEDTGASFSKLGQQLSLRADLLPYVYCVELSKMLDRARPFPSSQAIAIIERNLGRPLNEVFEIFDPEPIGSASLACVYQATLKSGERVAVKVRRPGIGPLLAADLRALDWLLIIAEALTFIKPGQTVNFRHDLRKMLLGELNFRAEARYTEMFRLRAEKDGDGVTAPRVFFDYCTDEVMVNELVSGIWMWELMAAVDGNDHEFLAYARSLGIEPGAVARRLLRALHRELLEHLFFHADPHPANLVVLPNSEICFIDFGAVGRFSTETRNIWRELQYHMRNLDVGRMVHCTINLAGRLPPIDVDSVFKRMEAIYADWIYAVSSTDAEWWERSSAQNWLRYINVAREYGIPVSLETIQFFRATLLYDSIMVRLDKDIDGFEAWNSYAKQAGKDARRRVRKHVKKRIYGPTKLDYLRVEQLADMATQFAFKLQRSVEDPIVHFRNVVGKIAYSLSMLLRLTYVAVIVVGLAVAAEFVAERWFGRQIPWSAILEAAASVAWLQIILALAALVVLRRVLLRMNEPDKRPDSTG